MSLKPRRVDFQSTWRDLRETVKGVIMLNGSVSRIMWNDRFSDVYSLCVAQPDSLADQLYAEMKSFLESHVKGLLQDVKAGGESELLTCYSRTWEQYSHGIDYVHKLFLYLNTQHIKKHKMSDAEATYGPCTNDMPEPMREIGELGLDIWRREMIVPLQYSLVSQLLAFIQADRLGEGARLGTSVVQTVVLSLVAVEEFKKKGALELYVEIFETPFLQASGQFFRQESTRMFEDCSVARYMEKVLQKLEEEQLRATKFLHPSSFSKVTSEFQARMVADRLEQLHAECKPLVYGECAHDLRNLYALTRPVPNALAPLVQEVQDHINKRGMEAIATVRVDSSGPNAAVNANAHIAFVENILTVHKKYEGMIQNIFSGDQAFVGALDKACAAVINYRTNSKQPCRSSELLARYCDSLLRKSSKGLSDTEVEEKLGQSITVFKYIDDKDVFQKFYARMLAKRLIHQQSQSMDAEEAMINRLKQACGYEFTNKLHRMFTDMSLSADLNAKFNDFLSKENVDVGIGFSIHVLQAGAWPLTSASPSQFALPQQLEKSVQMFEAFYRSHFSGRKLSWLQHLSQGEVRLGYTKRPYFVTMQTYQMALMLPFESGNVLTCRELQEATRLNDESLGKYLASLVDCKLLICKADLVGETPSPEVEVQLNLEYSNKRTKFRIAGAVQRETQHETEQTHSSVEEDRKLYLQATIVRIMKSRKLLKHNALVQEVLSQSKFRFAPSISLIKKCIETLIDKQYLERTVNTSDEYSYVA